MASIGPRAAEKGSPPRFLRGLWQRYVTDVREQAEGEAAAYRSSTPLAVADRRMVIILSTVIGSLLLVRYFGNPARTTHLEALLDGLGLDDLSERLRYAMSESTDRRFNARILWAAARVIGYAIIPLLVVRLVLRERLRSFGTGVRGILKHWKVYFACGLVLAPLLFAASYGAAFQAKYPYYKLAPGESLWPFFIGWELLYACQFISLEFLFRGFMIHGLRARLGYATIFVMMVPYLMIHFNKPLPEALAAIIAGFVLGTLSFKSNSIWWGAVLHVAAAWSMDALSLWHQGLT